MKKRKINLLKKILLEKRKKMHEEKSELITGLRDNSLDDGDLSKFPSDLADLGTDTLTRETAYIIIERQDKYLKEIDRALQRIEINEYGICRLCGKEICNERLLAVPTTNICVSCKTKK